MTISVCLATTTFPRWKDDGEGAFVWGLAHSLSLAGVKVRVVSLHTPEALHKEVIEGIEVVRPSYWWPSSKELLRKERGGLPVTLRRYPLAQLQFVPFFAIHTATIARIARTCDIIHAHWTLSAGAAIAGQAWHGRPVLATVQGSDILQVARHPLGARLTHAILTRCFHVTALSGALADATEEVGVDRQHISVIPNGVDIQQFQPPQTPRDKLILFVGSCIERKGICYLLQALPDIFARLPGYRAVIIGDGPLRGELEALSNGLGLENRVSFHGFLPQSEIRRWMQRARLFVLPSLEEGQGVVSLEAMACGTPVLASAVDGICEVVTPDVGRLVPPRNPAMLTQAAIEILETDANWHNLSIAARQRAVEVYDWETITQHYLTLYERALS